jgi:hypothetical protein
MSQLSHRLCAQPAPEGYGKRYVFVQLGPAFKRGVTRSLGQVGYGQTCLKRIL